MDESNTKEGFKILFYTTTINIIIEYHDSIGHVLNNITSLLVLGSIEDYNFFYMNKNLKHIKSNLSFIKTFNSMRREKENPTMSFKNCILVENKYTFLNSPLVSEKNENIIDKSSLIENIRFSNNHTEEILSHKNKFNFLLDNLDRFSYLNSSRMEILSHRNYVSNLKAFTYKKNDFINLIRFPLHGLNLNRFTLTEENLKEIEILKIFQYIKNEIKIVSMEISLNYLIYINNFEDLEVFLKLEELIVFNPESRIYSTKEYIDNSNILLSEGKFFNIKSLFLENCEIQVLDNIIHSSRNLKSIHLKNVTDIKDINCLRNIKSFINIQCVILEYKEISKLYQILDLLSFGFVEMNIRLLSLKIIIDSIDLELGFSIKKLENFKIIKNTDTLFLDLNCVLSDNFDKPLKFNFLHNILKEIIIKPFSEFKIQNFQNLFLQNFMLLNEILLDNVEIWEDEKTAKAIENVNYKNPNLKTITINSKKYSRILKGHESCMFIEDNLFSPYFFIDSKKLKINITLIHVQEFNRFTLYFNTLIYRNRIDKLVIEDVSETNMNSLQYLSVNLRNLKEIKIRNLYINSMNMKLIKILIDNNSRLTALKFIKITNSKINKEDVEEFFDWIFNTAYLSHLVELKFCYLKFSRNVCNKFLTSKLLRQLKKISFSNLKSFTFFEDSLELVRMDSLKFISIKNVETKLEDLKQFFIIYSNQLVSIRIDVDVNLLNLFVLIKFPNLIELEISDNLFKYTQSQKENIINAIDSLYLKKLPFNFKNISREFKLSINKKFKFINI